MPVWPDGDAVEFEWTGSGTGSVVAGSALTHRRLPPASNDARSGVYFIRHATLNEWEKSVGTWTNSTQTLTRGEGTIIGSNGAGLVPFTASGLKVVSWVASGNDLHALELFRGGGATINEVAAGPGAYEFVAGGPFALTPSDPKLRSIKVLGPADGALTATMQVVLDDPDLYQDGDEHYIEKGDTTNFTVTVCGLQNPVVPTVDVGTNVLTSTAHGMNDGTIVIFRRGTLPSPLVAGTPYFVVGSTVDTFQVSASLGGAAIDLLTAGSGFVMFRRTVTLTRPDQFVVVKVVGNTSKKWENQGAGQQSLSAHGQDIFRATDAGGVRALQRITNAAEFTTDRTAADTDTNLGRLRFQGTVPRRFDAPSGLAVGTDFEVVVDHDLAGIAPLTVERTSGDGNIRLGGPIGCRILRPGAICRVRVFEDGVWIGDGLDPAPMAAQNGGASFLLERALKQVVSGGVLQSWGDRGGLNDFIFASGEPGVGAGGQMTVDAALDADTHLDKSVTYAGTSLLFGFAMRIDAASSSINYLGPAGNFTAGRGLYLSLAGAGVLNCNILHNVSTISNLNSTYQLGRRIAAGVAINRTSGYAYGFFDEGYTDREREEVLSGLTFVVDWTTASVNATVGPTLGASESFTGEYYAWTIRDNLSNFASVNNARDQAAAMLAEMRAYYV